MSLPLLISVPHAGLDVPPEAAPYCVLSAQEIRDDGDVGAAQIYGALEPAVAHHVTTHVARAIVDLNRAEDDRRPDGVVKTHTCWNVPVYHQFPPESVVSRLLELYYHPFHARLRELATSEVVLGIDCHTMAAAGPPVGPDPGVERPRVCLSHADGTCPQVWMDALRRHFVAAFGDHVNVNDPFRGGFITRSHAAEIPWVQLELSRSPYATDEQKATWVVQALEAWCDEIHESIG